MKSVHSILFVVICLLTACNSNPPLRVTPSDSDLQFSELSQTWDEGIPLGNAIVGALVWQKDSSLRFSLDRIDLWDLRPMDSLAGPNHRFSWVYERVMKNDYSPVQAKYDEPYELEAGPSKIPGAALEFSTGKLGKASNVRLYLNNALCEVNWPNGTSLKTFVHATEPIGWFIFENLTDTLTPRLLSPRYQLASADSTSKIGWHDLRRLGYEQGDIIQTDQMITYHQKGWGDFYYDVTVQWQQEGGTLKGVWSISTSMCPEKATEQTQAALTRGIGEDYRNHTNFWDQFWAQSSVNLPDSVLQKQYMNEMYKFGSAARENSYPIALQAVWTADDGQLPPWKGDYHHDLNTQLSYWPCYTGNYLKEGLGYLNTLWDQRDVYKKYTSEFFETEGINVPGVCTLTGEPMGGWTQYSMSPTVSAWLSQHFYLHWKYSADREFLKEKGYPFLKETATYLENFSIVNEDGVRKLKLSSSPEIFDNSINAWFKTMTNYDLALMKFAFKAASEMAGELDLQDEAAHWKEVGGQLQDFDIDETGCLTFAKGVPYEESHRHFSHAMAIHPLGLIDWSQGEEAQHIIKATIKKLDDFGPDWWVGYSYSWLANMKARAFDGEGAAEALRTFADCFCLKNTFHVNGDQTKSGKSKFTYRPFTLEGNFAFASGIQDMLMQSHTGIIRIFPAIPAEWQTVSFDKLRAMGAFLVSADKKDGNLTEISIYPEQGGKLRLASPFGDEGVNISGHEGDISIEDGIISLDTRKGQVIKITKK